MILDIKGYKMLDLGGGRAGGSLCIVNGDGRLFLREAKVVALGYRLRLGRDIALGAGDWLQLVA